MAAVDNPLLNCETREQLASLLGISTQSLTYFAYGENKKYKTFEIPKKSGGRRKIAAPIGALKTIQRKLATHLTDLYPDPPYVHGFLNDKSVLTNATPHLNKSYVFNIDLKDFFPSITANRVYGLLRAHPFNLNQQVASAIVGITCNNGALPQGAPTSPILSNMICFRMDKALRKFGRKHSAIYTRYADDITFSFNGSIPEQIVILDEDDNSVIPGENLNQIIVKNYFEINPLKTRLSRNGQAKFVTGIKVNVIPNLSRRYIRQLKNMLNAWEKHGLEKAQKVFVDEFNGGERKFENVIWGKLLYLKSIKSKNDITYARLYNKYAELEGLGRPLIPISEIERLYSQVYVVESLKKDATPEEQQGTGFLLGGKWFITCSHVAQINADDLKYFRFNQWIPQDHRYTTANEATRSNKEEFDLVTMTFSDTKELRENSFSLAPESFNIEVGQEFKVIGFPSYRNRDKPNIVDVKVTALNENGTYEHAFVGQKLTGGYSGGPVLDSNNFVVGVALRGEEYATSNNAFLPIQELRKYLVTLDN
jgi:retron-type reverse transcriptase